MPLDANKFKPKAPAEPPASLAAIRERFQRARPRDETLVPVDFHDGAAVVQLLAVSPSAGDKWRINAEGYRAPETGPDGKTVQRILPRKFWPLLIAMTYRDPETRELVWPLTDDEAADAETLAAIAAMDERVVDQLIDPALRLGGYSQKAREALEGDSGSEGATPGAAPSTISPAA